MASLKSRKTSGVGSGLACLLAALAVWVGGVGWSGAADQPGEFTLAEAWQFALKHSPAALEAKVERRRGQRQHNEALSRLLPQLEFVGGPVLNNYADGENYSVANLILRNPFKEINQQLFKLVNRDRLLRMGELTSQSILENLKLELVKGYCQYHFLTEKKRLLEEWVQLGRYLEMHLAGMPKGSVNDLSLLMEIRRGLSRDRDNLENLHIELLTLQADLKRLIGRSYSEPFLPGGDLAELVSGLSEKSLEPLRPGTNLDLQLLQEKLKLADSKYKFDRLRNFPEPVFSLDLGWGPILRPRGASQDDVDGFKYQVFLGLKWTLWDWGRTRAEIDESSDNRDLLKKKMDAFLEKLEFDWQLIRTKRDLFKKRVVGQEELLTRAQTYTRMAHEEYLAGRAPFRSYFELWRQSGELQLSVMELKKSILLFQVEVCHLFGGLDSLSLFK